MRGAAVVCAALAIAAACTRFDVKSSRDPAADLGRLRTFAWLPPEEADPADQRVNNRFIDRRIRTAADATLREKGYQPSSQGPADFLLNYRLSMSPSDGSYGHGPAFARGQWGGWPEARATYDSYDVGTLYIAVLDGTTKQAMWVGKASTRILPHISDDRAMKRVDAAVKQILASFPKH